MSLIDTVDSLLVDHKKRVVTIDIETAQLVAKTYRLKADYIPWKFVETPTKMVSLAAKPYGEAPIYSSVWDHGEANLLKTAREILDWADIVVTWNGKKFDEGFINRELAVFGLTNYSPYRRLDLMQEVKRIFNFDSNALGFVAQQLGVTEKVTVSSIPDLLERSLAGDDECRRIFKEYNIGDVITTEAVYDNLRFRGWLPKHPQMIHDGRMRCVCGSDSLNLLEGKFYYTPTQAYPIYQCVMCKTHVRGRKSIMSTGSSQAGVV